MSSRTNGLATVSNVSSFHPGRLSSADPVVTTPSPKNGQAT